MNSFVRLLQDTSTRLPAAFFFTLVALQAFFAPYDFGIYHGKTSDGMDGIVVVKLALAAICFLGGTWGFFTFAAVRAVLGSVSGLFFAALIVLTMLGASSGVAMESIPISLINYTFFVFVVTAIHVLGFRVFGLALTTGIAFTAIMATFLFYFIPEVGVFSEAISARETVDRLGGVGHPNSTARALSIVCILVLFLWRTREIPWWICIPFLVLFCWDATLAKSRTAIAAGTAAVVMLFIDKVVTRPGIAVMLLVFLSGLAGCFVLFATGRDQRLVDQLVGRIAKSGDKSEIVTVTGRVEIWSEAIAIIAQRPLLGYGLSSAPKLLPDFGQSTHNAFLNAAMGGGVLAGFIMVGFFIKLCWDVLDSPHFAIRAFCMYLLLSFLLEDTVLDMFPGPGSLIWFACIALHGMTIPVPPIGEAGRFSAKFDAPLGTGSPPSKLMLDPTQ